MQNDKDLYGGGLQYGDLPRPEKDPLCKLSDLREILKACNLCEVSHKLSNNEEIRIYNNYGEYDIEEVLNKMDREQLILLMFNAGKFVGHNEVRRELKKVLQIPR